MQDCRAIVRFPGIKKLKSDRGSLPEGQISAGSGLLFFVYGNPISSPVMKEEREGTHGGRGKSAAEAIRSPSKIYKKMLY
ncbi:hypothetical protein CLOM621_06504 [Clostridium sp. M62/1]|nr:hypothetical protein CLOM621_06504 [Clostridium sp. M62/1]